jgi:hypothetical protein
MKPAGDILPVGFAFGVVFKRFPSDSTVSCSDPESKFSSDFHMSPVSSWGFGAKL